MDDRFCDQSQAYRVDSTVGSDAQAVTVYEQFKEAIEQVGGSLADDEKLLVVWYDPAGGPVAVEHLGYYGQSLLVLRGRDSEGLECTALAPAVSVQLLLKKVKKLSDTNAFNFMGHSVFPESPPGPSA